MRQARGVSCPVLHAVMLPAIALTLAALAAADPPAEESVEQIANRIQEIGVRQKEAELARNDEAARKLAEEWKAARAEEQRRMDILKRAWMRALQDGRAADSEPLAEAVERACRQCSYARTTPSLHRNAAPFDVVLSEVCYWPKAGEPEWVELTNNASRPVDVSRWMIADGQALNWTLPEKLAPVPPGGCVLILLDGKREAPQVDEKGARLVLHAPAGRGGDALGDRGGHVALYSSAEVEAARGIAAMRGYVTWGEPPAKVLVDAIYARRWRRDADVVAGTSPATASGRTDLEPGGTTGLVAAAERLILGNESWRVFAPSEASPGKANPRPAAPPPAADGAPKTAPAAPKDPAIEKIDRLADRVEELAKKLNEANRAGDDATARKLVEQLRQAQKEEEDGLKELRDAAAKAMKSGDEQERRRLSELMELAARHCSYGRSMETARPRPAPFDVVISEVCCRPRAGEAEWVELTNIAAKPVDVSRWTLNDGQALHYTLPEKLAPVPPGGCVLILLDGKSEPPRSENGGTLITLHGPGGEGGNLLGDRGGQVGLLAPVEEGDMAGLGHVRGFVAWGRSPGIIYADAAAANRWQNSEELVRVPAGTILVPMSGVGRTIAQGGTIALAAGETGCDAWCVLAADEASPGRPNPRIAPVPYLPVAGASTGEDGLITLSADRAARGALYHFQVCWDEKCEAVFLNPPPDRLPSYRLAQPVPKGRTVWWRVRAVYPDGTAGPWSPPRKLVNNQ